ncbi:MAG: GGDEF domain-containing protein [Chloroflexi bacterium]|nr:GGDEF domain-containing protein [Chloroflexota bacterium]
MGDVRGGISITSPFIMKIPILSLLLGHAILGLIGIFGIAITASKLNRAYETIKTHALFDDLTGIPNRRNFTENIVMEYKRCQRNQQALSIILCDIDSFKQFNDTYGHNSGDQCLKKVAQTIKKSLLRPGDFCARYGGEEFIVLLPNTPLEGAAQIAETIRANIEQLKIPNKNSTANEFVTLSLGITTCNDTSTEFYEEIVKQADNALYRAKKLGKNQLQCFNPA